MFHKKTIEQFIVGTLSIVALASAALAQDYDGEAETAITGLGGLGGLGGLTGLSGLTALANGVVTGYAPISAGSESGSGSEMRAIGASESSDADSGDYDEDSNDSSASEEHPILSKFFNLISGGRHKRSVDQPESLAQNTVHHVSEPHSRVKRGYKGWVPYVSTYVKTDKKANFKWGVKAKVGKKYGK